MKPLGRLLLFSVALFALALAEPGQEEWEQNRRRVEKYRADPERLARLRRALRAFHALPLEEQSRIRKLDQDLAEEESVTQTRLWRVLERYAEWLERLPDDKRREVENAPDGTERLRRIRQLRDQEYVERLPLALRARVEEAPADRRAELIADLRREERRRHDEWKVALRNWTDILANTPQPARLADLPPEVQRFYQEMLRPALTPAELRRLDEAEGQWPLYPRTLVELADRHATPLPGPMSGPARPQEMPTEVQKRLERMAKTPPRLKRAEGKWPDYAVALLEMPQFKQNPPHRPLGPVRAGDLPPTQRQFVQETLTPLLKEAEKDSLKKAEGQWPQYPRRVLELTRAHNLVVPHLSLPGPRDYWDRFRPQGAAIPTDVPDAVLRDFLAELTPDEKMRLGLSLLDPVSRDRAKQEWIRRNPEAWQKMVQVDIRKRLKKMKAQE